MDVFLLYCSHCLQQSSTFSLGREGGTSLSTRLTSHSHDVRSSLLSKYWPFCIYFLDSKYCVFTDRLCFALRRDDKSFSVIDPRMFFNDVIYAGSSENSICDLSNRKFRFHLLVCGHLVSSNATIKKYHAIFLQRE